MDNIKDPNATKNRCEFRLYLVTLCMLCCMYVLTVPHHDSHLVQVICRAGQDSQARANLIVTVSTTHRQHGHVTQILRRGAPAPPDRRVEIYSRDRKQTKWIFNSTFSLAVLCMMNVRLEELSYRV